MKRGIVRWGFLFALLAGTAAQSAGRSAALAKLPAFRLRDLRGREVAYSPGEVVVLNFFASWCTSCVEEIPVLQRISEAYPNARLIGIDVGEDATRAGRWVKKHEYPWRVLLDVDRSLTDKLAITAIPVTIIVDKSGRITYRGARPPENIGRELARARQ